MPNLGEETMNRSLIQAYYCYFFGGRQIEVCCAEGITKTGRIATERVRYLGQNRHRAIAVIIPACENAQTKKNSGRHRIARRSGIVKVIFRANNQILMTIPGEVKAAVLLIPEFSNHSLSQRQGFVKPVAHSVSFIQRQQAVDQ